MTVICTVFYYDDKYYCRSKTLKKRSSNYLKIYKKFHGVVPKDDFGRVYDIHHIDGNHDNNSIENLVAIPIQEHYNIHYNQQDYKACVMIALRMKMSVSEISRLNSLAAYKRVEEGTHHWKTEEHSKKTSERVRNKVKDGTYHMIGGKIQKEFQLQRSKNNAHQWNGSKQNQKMLANGTHPSLKVYECPHCKKTIKSAGNAFRWHFDKCKEKQG
jgi:HNH endonuclease